MDHFSCPECSDHNVLTMVDVTEDETHDGVTKFMGECPEHAEVSVDLNWRNP